MPCLKCLNKLLNTKNPDPSSWGPEVWRHIHELAFNSPENPTINQKLQMYNFIVKIPLRIPCQQCAEHLIENLKTLKFNISHVQNRLAFSKFVYDLHQLNFPYTFQETLNKYIKGELF
eukprot:Pgem_evm2s4547